MESSPKSFLLHRFNGAHYGVNRAENPLVGMYHHPGESGDPPSVEEARTGLIWQPDQPRAALIALPKDLEEDFLREALKDAFGPEAASLHYLAFQAQGGAPLAAGSEGIVFALPTDEVKAAREQCESLKLGETDLYVPAQAVLHALQGAPGRKERTLILDLSAEETLLLLEQEGRVSDVAILPWGLKALGEGMREVLKLRFAGSAIRLLFNGVYDFSNVEGEIADLMIQGLLPVIQDAVPGLTGKPLALALNGLPPGTDWLTSRLAQALKATPLVAATEFGELSSIPRETWKGLEHPPLATAALLAGQESAWLRSFFGSEAFPLDTAGRLALTSARLSEEEVAAFSPQDAEPSSPARPSEEVSEGTATAVAAPKPKVAEPAVAEAKSAPIAKPQKEARPAAARAPKAAAAQEAAPKKKPAGLLIGIAAGIVLLGGGGAFLAFQAGNQDRATAAGLSALTSKREAVAPETPVAQSIALIEGEGDSGSAAQALADATPATVSPAVNELEDGIADASPMIAEETFEPAADEPAAGSPGFDLSGLQDAGSPAPGSTPSSHAIGEEPEGTEAVSASNRPLLEDATPAESGSQPSGELAALEPEAAPEPPPPPPGELDLTAAEGVSIAIDGEPFGEHQVRLSELELGTYHLRFEAAGYRPEERTIELTEADPQFRLEGLALERRAGDLLVQSQPDGARATVTSIDEPDLPVRRGQTPFALEALPEGRYEVRLERTGWEPEVKTIEVRDLEHTAFEHVYREGSLQITSRPSGATVTALDGKRLGRTPLLLEALPEGDHHFVLEYAGHETARLDTTVTAFAAKETAVELIDLSGILFGDQLHHLPRILPVDGEMPNRLLLNDRIENDVLTVEVVVTLARDGSLENIEVRGIDPRSRAARQAVRFIEDLRFGAGLRNGHPVRSRAIVPLVFYAHERFQNSAAQLLDYWDDVMPYRD